MEYYFCEVQEALTNAVRHRKASLVRLIFLVEGEELRLTITNSGNGAFEIVKGIGLVGMEERLGDLSGSVSFERAPEDGFSLMEVPVKATVDAR